MLPDTSRPRPVSYGNLFSRPGDGGRVGPTSLKLLRPTRGGFATPILAGRRSSRNCMRCPPLRGLVRGYAAQDTYTAACITAAVGRLGPEGEGTWACHLISLIFFRRGGHALPCALNAAACWRGRQDSCMTREFPRRGGRVS